MHMINRLARRANKGEDHVVVRNPQFDAQRSANASPGAARAPDPSRFRSILVPIDGGSFGEHALPLALGIARRAGATLRLVHVHRPLDTAYAPSLYYDGGLESRFRRQSLRSFDELVKRIDRTASVDVRPQFLLRRDVADGLFDAAVAGVDLVVMATHRRGPFGRLLFGSMANALLDRLTVPIVLVQGCKAPVDLAGDPMPRRVVIPVDGSETSRLVVDPALALGALAGAKHHLLRVVRWEWERLEAFRPKWVPRTHHGARTDAWNDLCRAADEFSMPTSRVGARLLHTDRSVANTILDFAAREADLIAMTTRRRVGLARIFNHSVARQILQKAPIPVMVLPVAAEPDRALVAGRDGPSRPQTRQHQENVR